MNISNINIYYKYIDLNVLIGHPKDLSRFNCIPFKLNIYKR